MNMDLIKNDLVQLGVLLPPNFDTLSPDIQENVVAYLKQLDPIERRAYHIAIDHLGSSFHLLRSNGFCDWKKGKK